MRRSVLRHVAEQLAVRLLTLVGRHRQRLVDRLTPRRVPHSVQRSVTGWHGLDIDAESLSSPAERDLAPSKERLALHSRIPPCSLTLHRTRDRITGSCAREEGMRCSLACKAGPCRSACGSEGRSLGRRLSSRRAVTLPSACKPRKGPLGKVRRSFSPLCARDDT